MSLLDEFGRPVEHMPVDTEVSPEIRKAVAEATGAFVEQLHLHKEELTQELQKSHRYSNEPEPKGYFTDPFSLLDSLGMGYRANPSQVTYDTLRQMTERDTLLAAIILTRIRQTTSFCRPQPNKYSIGYKLKLRGRKDVPELLSRSERERIERMERFLRQMGMEPNIERDDLPAFVSKMVRDRLTYDQVNFEKVGTVGGKLHSVLMHDASTIRIAHVPNDRGAPVARRDLRTMTRYVQILNGEPVAEFTPTEMAFCIANPRTHHRSNGYGYPEPQMLIQTVTSHIWAEEWNRKAFSQGSTIKGVLNMKGPIPRQQYEAFKRQWTAQVAGVHNAWRTPILNSDGIEWVPLQMSNTEMGYQMWIEYLVKITCAIYQIDPAEINFDLRGSTGQQPVFMSSNEAQQKASKDRGLQPLLHFIEDNLNKHVVWVLDDGLELAFVGLDAKTEEQAIDLRQKQAQTTHTLNEARALEDLPPVENGDVVMNPQYIGYLNQMAMQQGQGGGMAPGMMPGQPGQPGAEGEEPPQDPYAGRIGGKPGAEEKHAKNALAKLADDASSVSSSSHLAHLRNNDWQSTVHASVRGDDLRKSATDDDPLAYFDLDV